MLDHDILSRGGLRVVTIGPFLVLALDEAKLGVERCRLAGATAATLLA